MSDENKEKLIPVVSLGDGTWVVLTELPTIMFFTEKEIEEMDEAPIDCEETTHIHIEALLNNSHWNDTCKRTDHNPTGDPANACRCEDQNALP